MGGDPWAPGDVIVKTSVRQCPAATAENKILWNMYLLELNHNLQGAAVASAALVAVVWEAITKVWEM